MYIKEFLQILLFLEEQFVIAVIKGMELQISDLAQLEHICLSSVFYALCHLLVHTCTCLIPISSSL